MGTGFKPLTLIALDNHHLPGSASLVKEDLPETELRGTALAVPWSSGRSCRLPYSV